MSQLKIAQVSGLKSALDSKVEIAANVGSSGVGIFYQKSGTSLQFNKLDAGNGIVSLAVNSNVITIAVDVGTTANKILQLDSTGKIPAVNGSLLTNINPANISGSSGALPLTNLLLPNGQFYIGNASNNPTNIAKSAIPLSGFGVPTASIDIGSQKIYTSASSWASNELVPKSYVDAAVQGNVFKPAAKVATKSNINLSAPGANIDGITMVIDDRVAVLGQTDPTQNGIYLFKGGGSAMVRSADCDSGSELLNMAIYIEEGTYSYQTYKLITTGTITIGVTALEYTQIGGAAEIIAGDGLDRAGSTFSVAGDGTTIGIVNSNVSIISSATAGQVLLSAGGTTQTATWGALDLTNSNATTGALPVNRGGTSLSSLVQHSLLGSISAANSISALTLSINTMVGRKSGNIVALSKADIREIVALRPVVDISNAVNGNMKLATLSQTPDDASKVLVFFNGNLLRYNTDYTVSSTDINATNALNITYGGSGADGLGFQSTDVITCVFFY